MALSDDTVATLVTLAVGFLTWGYHKLKGDKVDSFDDQLRGIGKQVVHALLTDPNIDVSADIDLVKAKATELLWKLATSAGIPRNSLTEPLATAVIEHTVGDVLEQLRVAAGLEGKMAALNDQIAGFPAQLAKIEAEAFARGKAFADQMVERVDQPPPTSADPPASTAPAP